MFPYRLHFTKSRSPAYSQAIELAELAAKHEICESEKKPVHIVSFADDQIDLMAALFSLSLSRPRDPLAQRNRLEAMRKLRQEGYYEFTHICSDAPIDLSDMPRAFATKPKKEPHNYRHPAYEDIRHLIVIKRYDDAVVKCYDLLGDRLHFSGQLHNEFLYLKRLGNVPLLGRDLLYFRPDSRRSELVKSCISEYCSCVDTALSDRRKLNLESPLDVLVDNVPTMEQLIEERNRFRHSPRVHLKEEEVEIKCDTIPVTIESFSAQCDKCFRGVFFKIYPDPVQLCKQFEIPDSRTYDGLWTTHSPMFYQEHIMDKGLRADSVDAYVHKLWRGRIKYRTREPDFTTATSLTQLEKRSFGTKGIRYTGRSHMISGRQFYEIDLIGRKDHDKAVDLGNPFVILVEEILQESENLLRERHGLPRIGEGWIAEMRLYNLLKTVFPDAEHHASPEWLKPQHLDVFISSQKLAFEYQGLQHFEPVDFFGGETGFAETKRRDRRKSRKCRENGAVLIEWRHDEPINIEVLSEKLENH